MMDGALEPQEAFLGYQRSWTSYFFGPGTTTVVYFLLEGLSHPPREPFGISFSLAQDWALIRDQQEAEEGEEEGSLGLRLVGLLGGRCLVPPFHELPQTSGRFWSHPFFFVI